MGVLSPVRPVRSLWLTHSVVLGVTVDLVLGDRMAGPYGEGASTF